VGSQLPPPKWPILCRVGRKTLLIHPRNQPTFSRIFSYRDDSAKPNISRNFFPAIRKLITKSVWGSTTVVPHYFCHQTDASDNSSDIRRRAVGYSPSLRYLIHQCFIVVIMMQRFIGSAPIDSIHCLRNIADAAGLHGLILQLLELMRLHGRYAVTVCKRLSENLYHSRALSARAVHGVDSHIAVAAYIADHPRKPLWSRSGIEQC